MKTVLFRVALAILPPLAACTPTPGPASGALTQSSEAVPWDSVMRGVGVVAFREPGASGLPRVDTLTIRERPSPASPVLAMVVFDERGPGEWYTLLAAPGVQRNAAEIAYEELAVPFDSVAGHWAHVIYGRSATGQPQWGWVETSANGVRTLRWADLLRQHTLYLADPVAARFHASPGGPPVEIPLAPPNSTWPDYDLEPIEAAGEWMQVRIVVPSICSGLSGSRGRVAWIQYLDSSGQPLVWPRTRGC
jgi:hypothetical protein